MNLSILNGFQGQRNSLLYERLALLADKEKILETSEK